MHKTAILLSLVPTVETRYINNFVFCPDAYAKHVVRAGLANTAATLYPWEEQRQSDGACFTLPLPG